MSVQVFLYLLVLFGFGIILGSYLNSWMWRVHEKRWRFGGGSMCIHCSRALRWYENIPLLSFIFLGGRCRTCKGIIPVDYFLVELATGIIFAGLGWHYADTDLNVVANFVRFSRDCIFWTILLIVFVYDWKYQIIVSGVVWSGAFAAFCINYFYLHVPLGSLALGCAVGGGFFLLQYAVSRGRWIGGGDVRLGAMMGLLLGWPHILVALFVSYVLGAIVAIPLLITKKTSGDSHMPFGTFLAIGTLFAMYFGGALCAWYTNLIGY